MAKPSIPQGTRDFGPDTVRKRYYIFKTIQEIFELYAFQPLETPAIENLDTLLGKYGDEGDKLIFKILNNGLNDPKNLEKSQSGFDNALLGKSDKSLTERALRYDLTIPFARYVAMNFGQLTFPFKRYQIQPVWRADRPQKGRYREFYQCDADVVGSGSLYSEVELASIYQQVFAKLNIPAELRINSRKILTALAEVCGEPEKMIPITVTIDKLDKIGLEKVKEELLAKLLSTDQVAIIEQYLLIAGSQEEKLDQIRQLLGENAAARSGIAEIEFVIEHASEETRSSLVIDFTLARGLNYYTGIIFEAKALNIQIGSIGGGGRYDDLTGLFDRPGFPGVGISFGVDRIYDVMEELALFPKDVQAGAQVLFFNLGEAEAAFSFSLMQQLRTLGTSCDMYHEPARFEKQFKYAERRNISFVVMIGTQELQDQSCTIKNLHTGEQETVSIAQLLEGEWKNGFR